jgi:hypothetical protein
MQNANFAEKTIDFSIFNLIFTIEPLAKVGHSVIPANPGSGPGQAPESRIA